MSSLKEIGKIAIAEHWLLVIEYGDVSGYTEEDQQLVDNWMDEYGDCCFQYGDDVILAEDSVSGRMMNCIEVIVFRRE